MATIIAKNLTGSSILLRYCNQIVPASGQVTLTDSSPVYEIQNDKSLIDAINANQIILNDGYSDLSKQQSLNVAAETISAAVASVDNNVWKIACRLATTGNIALSGIQTIDGYSANVGDRLLVKHQTIESQNGLFTVQNSSWTRTPDANSNDKISYGIMVSIAEGATHGKTIWSLTTTGAIVLGTTALTFEVMPGPSSNTVNGGGGGASALWVPEYAPESDYAPGANVICYLRQFMAAGTYTKMLTAIAAGGAAGRDVNMGVYSDAGTGPNLFAPGTKLAETGSQTTNGSTGLMFQKTLSSPLVLTSAGFYWVAIVTNNGGVKFPAQTHSHAAFFDGRLFKFATTTGVTLPSTAGSFSVAASAQMVYVVMVP